jgi:hypothetical protein
LKPPELKNRIEPADLEDDPNVRVRIAPMSTYRILVVLM